MPRRMHAATRRASHQLAPLRSGLGCDTNVHGFNSQNRLFFLVNFCAFFMPSPPPPPPRPHPYPRTYLSPKRQWNFSLYIYDICTCMSYIHIKYCLGFGPVFGIVTGRYPPLLSVVTRNVSRGVWYSVYSIFGVLYILCDTVLFSLSRKWVFNSI